MVHYKRFYGTTWNDTRPVRDYQQWYQSPCCDSWKNKTHKTTPRTKTNYLQKEKGYATQKWPNNKRFISQEAKQLLKKKVEEVVSFNSSKLNQHITHTKRETGETSRLPKKERRARCFACKQRGHFFWKCTDKEEAMDNQEIKTEATKVEPPNKQAVFKYEPETVHVQTDFMVQGSDSGNWDEIWYVSSEYKKHMTPMKRLFKRLMQRFQVEGTEEREKKFIVSYGVGEVVIDTDKGRMMIPNVIYTPEITLNILSLEQLKEQGYFVSYDGNRCKVWYMFDHMYDASGMHNTVVGESDENLMESHNKFLDAYFKSLDPDNECSLVKGMEDLKMKEDLEHDYVDSEYISMNGTLYFLKVNTYQRFIAFLDLIGIDRLVYANWETFKEKFMEMTEWFYKDYLGQEVIGELPPTVGVIKVDLLALYKFVDALGGYMSVSLDGNWHQLTKILGLAFEHQEAVKEIYKEYIGMMKLYYEEAKRVQGEPQASMSEMQPLSDARVNAYSVQGNTQVEAHTGTVQDMDVESPRKKHKKADDVMQTRLENRHEESSSSNDDFIIIT